MQQRQESRTPFDLAGGMPAVREVVERFYDLVEREGDYARLRALHAPDLGPMRASLAGFLAAWLGGPRDWFSEHPGVCMMSAHKGVPIDAASAREWAEAMTRAIRESSIDGMLGEKMAGALGDLAMRMAEPAAAGS